MHNIEQRLQAILDSKNLLEHPFYVAWSDGTLPAEKLTLYSGEYGAFINQIQAGWNACNEPGIGDIEATHFDMWKTFAQSIGQERVGATLPAVKELTAACDSSFENYATALGALYAFEAQQPATAKSKLKGLRDHYKSLGADELYFVVHEDDDEEPAMLLEKMEQLSAAEQDEAVKACEKVAGNLWNALSGIMEAEA